MQRQDIIMAIGRDDPMVGNNHWMSQRLWSRNIWHAFRLWDGWAHDWPYWRQMIVQYVNGHD
jgi:esterase/lipase superfamily enzyme